MSGSIAAVVLAGIAVAVFIGVGRGEGGSSDSGIVQSVLLVMGDNFFEPQVATMKAGQTYRIRLWNQGQAVHNFVAPGPDNQSGTGDDIRSKDVGGGEWGTIEVKFGRPGEYGFVCTYHAGMGGRITVQP